MTTRRRVVEVSRKRQAPQVQAIKVLVLPDESPDTSFLDQDGEEERKAEYERGDFAFVGVRAEADVVIEGVVQTLTSGGIWGVESDAGDEYLTGFGADEYADLRKILTSIGVSTSQLPAKMDPKWVEWRA